MPFAPHIRITALGRLGALAAERFSFGLNMHAPADDRVIGLAPNQTVWNDVAQDVVDFFGRASTRISQVAVLEEIKVASIGADGRYTGDPIILSAGPQAGSSALGNGLIAPQSALAISLTTERRGSSGRGRFYIPMPVLGVSDQDLLADQALVVAVRDSTVQLVEALNNQPGIDVLGLQCCVASSKGYNSTVTGVRVGRVIDTVRSRRRSIPETYTAVAPVG